MNANYSGVTTRELIAMVWRRKWTMIIVTSIFALASVALALYLPNQYTATVLLRPATTNASSTLSRLAGQFGGLAALAGVNIGNGGDADKSVDAIALAKSWNFLDQFIRENHIEVELIAVTRWNRVANKLEIDSSIYDEVSKTWIRKFDSKKGESAEPSSWELFKELSKRLEINQDKKTGIITISVEYYSPDVARDWVTKLVSKINRTIQDRDRREASKSIEYLQKQIGLTNISTMQNVFYKLIEEQTKNLMLADLSDEYVLKTLSPAMIPEEKSKPKRPVICVLGTLLGFLTGLCIIIYRRKPLSMEVI